MNAAGARARLGRLQPAPQHAEAVGQTPSSPAAGRSRTRPASAPAGPGSGPGRRGTAPGPSSAGAGRPAGPRETSRTSSTVADHGERRDGRTSSAPSRSWCRTAPATASRPPPRSPAAASNGCAGSGRNAAWSSARQRRLRPRLAAHRPLQVAPALLRQVGRSARPANRPPAPAPGSSAGRSRPAARRAPSRSAAAPGRSGWRTGKWLFSRRNSRVTFRSAAADDLRHRDLRVVVADPPSARRRRTRTPGRALPGTSRCTPAGTPGR